MRDMVRARAMVRAVVLFTALACDPHSRMGPPNATLKLSPAAPTMLNGMTLQLDAVLVTNAGQSYQVAQWSSSAPAIVEVDGSGNLTAKSVGSATITATTAEVIGQTTVTVIAPGGSVRTKYNTTCGITVGGELYCWGRNDLGQAVPGIGTAPVLSPTKIVGLSGVTSVSPGALHSCTTTSTASYCFGCNRHGELGDGGTLPPSGTPCALRSAPSQVAGGQTFIRIEAAGSDVLQEDATCSDVYCDASSCGVVTSGQLYCWGSQLSTPAALASSIGFTSVAMGLGTGCAIGSDKKIYCWSIPGFTDFRTTLPTISVVSTSASFQAVNVGTWHRCALDVRAAAWCWGHNGSGQLGGPSTETCTRRYLLESFSCRSQPDTVIGGYRFQSISAGGDHPAFISVVPSSHTCGVTVNQDIYCWGLNSAGQLGNGSQTNSQEPVKISSSLKFKSVSAGYRHTCAVSVDGAAYCWGENGMGQLGNGTSVNSSVPVPTAGGIVFR